MQYNWVIKLKKCALEPLNQLTKYACTIEILFRFILMQIELKTFQFFISTSMAGKMVTLSTYYISNMIGFSREILEKYPNCTY